MLQSTKEDSFDLKKMALLPIINKDNPSKKYSEKEEKFLREIGTYEFMNLEEPGLMHKFSYGKQGNQMKFTFFPGMKYKIPRFIARHVESCSTPIWSWRPDGMGSLVKTRTGTKSRFQMREVYE